VHFVDAAAMASSLIATRSEFLGGDALVGNMVLAVVGTTLN
jgi:hypothetical protein